MFRANPVFFESSEHMPSFTEIRSSVKDMTPRISEVRSCFDKPDFLSTLPSIKKEKVGSPHASDFHATLPATTDEELLLIDWKLKKDKHYREKLTRHLYQAGGEGSALKFMSKMLKALLARDLAIQYSMYGKKGKKPFVNLVEITAIMFGVASVKFPLINQDDISERLSRALALVCDWSSK